MIHFPSISSRTDVISKTKKKIKKKKRKSKRCNNASQTLLFCKIKRYNC